MRLDLNLLVVVDTIMQERNVTRAARALSMSQPAMSNALKRARKLLDDQLFEKVANGVRPTSRMAAIWPELHASLVMARRLVEPSAFDPASDRTTFRLAITDSRSSSAVPKIVLRLAEAAPLARVHFAVHTNADSINGLERGMIDCAVGMFPSLKRSLSVQSLNADRYVCVMRKDHALAAGMTLDGFVAATHVLVTPSGQDLGVVDGWLSLSGRTRTIYAVVNHFADALRIVSESDLITCVPRDYLERSEPALAERYQLTARALPFETDRILYKLAWHNRLERDPAHQWFRRLVSDVCS